MFSSSRFSFSDIEDFSSESLLFCSCFISSLAVFSSFLLVSVSLDWCWHDFSVSITRVFSVFIFILRSETFKLMVLTVFCISSRFCSFVVICFISSRSSFAQWGGNGDGWCPKAQLWTGQAANLPSPVYFELHLINLKMGVWNQM